MKRIIVLLLLSTSILVRANFSEDSISQIFDKGDVDTTMLREVNQYANRYLQSSPEELIPHLEKAVELAQSIKSDYWEIYTKMNLGQIFINKGVYDKAIEIFLECEKRSSEIDESELYIECVGTLAKIYIKEGHMDLAKIQLERTLKLAKENGSHKRKGNTHSMLGIWHKRSMNLDSAYYHFQLALKEQITGNLFADIPSTYNNMGSVHFLRQDYDSTEYYLMKSIRVNDSLGNYEWVAINFVNLGMTQATIGNNEKALKFIDSSLVYVAKINSLSYTRDIYYERSKLLYNMKRYEDAYWWQDSVMRLDDSLASFSAMERIEDLKVQYQTRQYQDSVKIAVAENEKSQVLADKNRVERDAEANKNRILIITLVAALLLIIGLIKLLSDRKKANSLIAQQKNKVEKQKNEIELQNHQLEEFRSEITQSISYAKKIQDTILPSQTHLNSILQDKFYIFYQPQHIVSGDFYLAWKDGNQIKLVVADCTGHGVPGAMVSMVGSNAIKKAVESLPGKPGHEILNDVNRRVQTSFQTEDHSIRDGMDISFCSISDGQLEFSGANLSLVVIGAPRDFQNDRIKNPIQ